MRVTYLSGTGFRDLVHAISTRGKRLTAFIIEIDETVIQIGNHNFFFGYGLQFNQYLDLCDWNLHIRGEKQCLLLCILLDLIVKYGKIGNR